MATPSRTRMPRHTPLSRSLPHPPPVLRLVLRLVLPLQLSPPRGQRHRKLDHRTFHIVPPVTILMTAVRTDRTSKEQRPDGKMTDGSTAFSTTATPAHTRTHAPYRTPHHGLLARGTHRMRRFHKRVSRSNGDHGLSALSARGVNDGLELFWRAVRWGGSWGWFRGRTRVVFCTSSTREYLRRYAAEA
jgi:hypothetical protein